jgi:hypothetical protein
MSTLPCRNEKRVTQQVQPAIELLTKMDELHSDVLLQHAIQPIDYHGGLVFRSAIESIRGTYIASSKSNREALVNDVLENLSQRRKIQDFKHTGDSQRYDFEIALKKDIFVAIEVKGGEGNSINISERPIWAKEFGIWSHLDGAIVNQPAHGAHSIVNRITNELVRRGKLVDVVLFKDILCGTRTRPCPKYPGCEDKIGLKTAPDIFLFPQRRPVFSPKKPEQHDPSPPIHTLETLRIPNLILDLFGVDKVDRYKHVWQIKVEVVSLEDGRQRRITTIYHQGEIVNQTSSRAWSIKPER